MPALLGGIVLMYLYDGALLLYHDEVAFETRRGGALVAGGLMLELGRRQLFLPPPLSVHRPLYRVSWRASAQPGDGGGAARLRRLAGRFSVLVPWSLLLLVLFAVGLPACVWLARTSVALLIWLAATYVTILATLAVAFAHRRRLGVTRGQLWSLARDALLCPPFALNLLRKISLAQSRRLDLRAVMAGAPGAGSTVALARVVQARIGTSLSFAQAGGDEESALRGALEFYERMAGHAG